MASISFPRLQQMSGTHKLIAVGAFAALAVAAGCSSGSATPASTTGAGAAGTSASAPATVTVASKGSVGAVLSNAQGMTLYRYTPDAAGVSNCTGGCAAAWPPLELAAGTTVPVAGKGVDGLGTIKRADGSVQVTYDKMPLYTFTGDSSVSEAKGQGLYGTWFVIKSGTSGTSGGSTATTKAPSGGGYGY